MGSKLKNFGLIGLGVIAGVAGSMQFDASAQKTTSTLPLEELRQLADVFGLIKTDYVEAVEDKKLLTEAISGMVASLDPHSAYLDKKAFKELREGTQGKFVGLGIEVGMEDGYVKVISPIEDSPAFKAGLKAGDLITRLDATPVKGLTLDEAVKRMRGEPNTKITLTIARKEEDKPLIITIVRQEIRVQSVKSKIIEPGYAWLRVAQFQEPTVDDMVKKINALYAQEPNLKGLVLDLRNDPGGVLPGAIGVSAAFLPKDVAIVSTNGQLPDSKATFYARREFYTSSRSAGSDPLAKLPEAVKKVPMVVLVNTGSASASEIVAGALQDYKRATIMGTQTFGKGSVQTIRQLSPETAVKLTTARYYTPNGRAIQAKGIVPDLLVDETADGDGLNGLRLREADLQKHLSNDRDKDEAARKIDELEEEQRLAALEKKRKPLEFGGKDDFQLAQALNHLKGKPVQLSKAPKVESKKENTINEKKNGNGNGNGNGEKK
ncbi:S41 family peptidase [Noviherbaspirillum cavernae]|uniref:S41 family peptidase n=1 Tax=Noviherbaspirillum cavernae TaxID=2320862 RepID=A0A418WXT1_9BURK|nr:S41 family peptidase [Noviherbaspirillum cavernae]RJG04895.1 S41 family peptidase [Noviherbaspirillum cavernae]